MAGLFDFETIEAKTKDTWLYLIVGGVWGLWHLPYYLFFLPQLQINAVLPVDRVIFAIVAIFSMICWSVMFVELYRITKSIWPVVILHMIEDSLVNHLIIDGHITISSGKEILISPIIGIITAVFYIIVGLLMRRNQLMKENNVSITL